MKSINIRKIEKKSTMQVCIDTGLHTQLKIVAARSRRSIRKVLEEYVVEILDKEKHEYN